jgi:MFS family permease
VGCGERDRWSGHSSAAQRVAERDDGSVTGTSTELPARDVGERRGLVPVLIFIGLVVAVISSLGAPLIPSIARADAVSLPDAQWSLTVTLVVGAVATPVLGRLGDGPRRRAVMLAALAVVVVGSVLAGLPLGFGWLLAGRGLQGIGLGLTPLGIATARDAMSGERARLTIAALSITVASGIGLGYPISGLIAEVGGVRAAFWFGGAVAAAALLAGALVLPESSAREGRRIDVLGALLLGVGLATGLLALGDGERLGWGSARELVLAGVAVVALAAWVGWELRTAAPLVDLRLARGRTVATAHVAALLVGLANYLLIASVPLLSQTPRSTGYGFGASVVVAGLLLVPFSAASVLTGRTSAWLVRRAGSRVLLPLGALVLGVAMVLFAVNRGSIAALCVMMAVAGLGVGTAFAGLPALVVSAVPAAETGSAMSLNQVLRYAGFAAGSATTGTVLAAATPSGGHAPAGAYTVIALIGLAACLLMALLTWLMPERTA